MSFSDFWSYDTHWPLPFSSIIEHPFTNTLMRIEDCTEFWRKMGVSIAKICPVSPIQGLTFLNDSLWLLLGSFSVLYSLRISPSSVFSFSFLAFLLFKSSKFLYSYTESLYSVVYAHTFERLLKCLVIYCIYKKNPFLSGVLMCGSNRSPLSFLCIIVKLYFSFINFIQVFNF